MMNRNWVGMAVFLCASSAVAIECPPVSLKCTAIKAATSMPVFVGSSALEAKNDDEPSLPQYADHCEAHLSLPALSADRTAHFSVGANYKSGDRGITVSTYSLNCVTANSGPCVYDRAYPSDSQDYLMSVGQSLRVMIKKFNVMLSCRLQ